jgi:hypothetical protein
MVRRIVGIGLLLAGTLAGQRSDTIYQVLTTDNSSTNYISGNVNNIGQAGHIVIVTFFSLCENLGITAQLEQSFDNSTWTGFGSPQGGTLQSTALVTPPNPALYYGAGAYPFVRFHIYSVGPTCPFNVYYSGSVNTTSIQASTGPNPTGSNVLQRGAAGYSLNPIITGGIGDGDTVIPTPVCTKDISANAVSAGTVSLGAMTYTGQTVVPSKIGFCFIEVTTAAATATVQFGVSFTGGGSPCASGVLNFGPIYNVTSSAPLVMGTGVGNILSYVTVPSAQPTLCMTVTGGPINMSAEIAAVAYFGQ